MNDAEAYSPALFRGRYRTTRQLGRGGLSTVYAAHDEFLGRDVAVKVFSASASADVDFTRQHDEINLLARLSHPNLVTLLDAAVDRSDADSPRIYYVMELVDGVDLQRRIDAGRLSARQIAQVGYHVATALEYVHHRGIVHRDIKPANILLASVAHDDARILAKLSDFGVASQGTSGPIGDDEFVTGTVAYLSPEQAMGDIVGPPSDVYSLGLVLLQCFTGELAFPGSAQDSALARLQTSPSIPEDLPNGWVPLLTAMMAHDPAARPSSRDLAHALRESFTAEIGRHRLDAAVMPIDEDARMQAVTRYDLLDTPPDGAFDRITALTARVLGTPIAIVSIVDHDRIWFKSHHGLDLVEVGRDAGLCASAILQDGPWVIEDARLDPHTLANPLVASDFGLQFYAGVPLRTRDGHNLGTLCVLDFEPRTVTEDELTTLRDLAAVVIDELDLRLAARQAASLLEETKDEQALAN